MSIQQEFSPICSSSWKYDVFLGFRGEDTRNNFIGHLYDALHRRGIHVFRDDKVLEKGEKISPGLLQAIEQSQFSIIVFSRNYASSTWCLGELVKIVECMGRRGQTVIPIFYDVDPSMVRKQTGDFHKAFAKHEETFRENIKTVQTWRSALTEVSNLSGWDAKDRHEQEFIMEIVRKISSKLNLLTCMNHKNLVGIDSRLEKLKMLIGEGQDDVRMIGICGMGGLGKTTIARVAYELISCEFEGSSFLANVREISKRVGLFSLQKVLLSQILDMKEDDINIYNEYDGMSMIRSRLRCKKVLVVIDDVDDLEQLNKLVGECDWFGLGSRIVITSRVRNVLTSHGIDEVYEPELLNDEEALEIVISKAFKKHQPLENFKELSKCVVKYADGLPLALEVLGSFLCGKEVHVWKDALKRLSSDSEKKILDRLQITFDGLEESEKKIFLDIACFFKGKDIHYVTRILESCGFFPHIGIHVLIDKSLLNISQNETLWMHDLLQEMGQQIVKRESLEEPGKRSRLWEEADIRHVLTQNTGTELIEGIMFEQDLNLNASAKSFSKMINLRLLEIHNVQLPEGLDYLSNKLRLFKWHRYPLKSLPLSFQPDKIVELDMHRGYIEQLWKGINSLATLTSVYLKACPNLRQLPDLTLAPNLENLFLNECPMLHRIHSTFFVHKKLICMKVWNCASLTTVSDKLHLQSLETLMIVNCPKLKKFPEILGRMECLRYLCLDGTAIKDIPSSIELLVGLEKLILRDNKNLKTIPSSINSLKHLQLLDLSRWLNLVSLPSMINGLESLEILNLHGCSNLASLPTAINDLSSLKELNLSGCSSLASLPSTINGMKSLQTLNLSACSNMGSLPTAINDLTSLRELNLSGCSSLASLPSTINGMESLQTLNLSACSNMGSLPTAIIDLTSLRELNLSGWSSLASLPSTINVMESLQTLDLSACSNLASLPSTINGLKCLQSLILSGCSKLDNIPETLGQLEGLKKLDLSGTAITQPVWSVFLTKNLEELSFRGCKGPKSKSWCLHFPTSLLPRRHIDSMTLMLTSSPSSCSLRKLDLSDCNLGEGAIPCDFFNRLFSLEELNLSANNFVSLPTSINHLPKLYYLELNSCKRLQSLPEFSARVDGGESLERFSSTLKLNNQKFFYISCVNCSKLFRGNYLMFSVLKDFLKLRQNPRDHFSMVVPGSEIPMWLRYRSEGCSIRITRPPNLYNYKLVGFIVCSVFVVRKHPPLLYNEKPFGTHRILCEVDIGERNSICFPCTNFYETLGSAMSGHVWLLYLPYSAPYFGPPEMQYNHIDFLFKEQWGRGLEVKRCGVHPIYEQDVEKFIQVIDQSTNSTSRKFKEFAQDCVGSTVDVTTAKRSLPDYEDEEPQPKKFKKFKFF